MPKAGMQQYERHAESRDPNAVMSRSRGRQAREVTMVGWVPVDISSIVEKKGAHPLVYFGSDKGDFLTLHVDPDMILDPIWMPRKTNLFLQNVVVLARKK
jgi:hypothetical protein